MTGDDTGDERVTELFRAAASEPPPPRFDHRDVVTASRRITARRRSAVAGGAVALLLVAVAVTVGALPHGGSATVTTASGAAAGSDAQADQAAPDVGRAAPEAAAAPLAAPGVPPSHASVVPLGPGTSGCDDRQDAALRALLAQVLPEAATAQSVAVPAVCVAGTTRSVTLELGGGTLSVASLPRGSAVSLDPGARSAPTASGGTVVVTAPPAYADRVDALLTYLAPRL